MLIGRGERGASTLQSRPAAQPRWLPDGRVALLTPGLLPAPGAWEAARNPCNSPIWVRVPVLVVAVSAFKEFFLLPRLACLFDTECVQVSAFFFFLFVKDFSVEMDECCSNNFGLQHPVPEKGSIQALKLYSLQHHTCLGSLMYQIQFTAELKKSVSY